MPHSPDPGTLTKPKSLASGLGRGNVTHHKTVGAPEPGMGPIRVYGLQIPRLLPSSSLAACYKCNMRRWTRDRNKRRKPGEKPGDKPAARRPAPLQPRFPDPLAAKSRECRQPEFEAQPDEAELQESQPVAESRRREEAASSSGAIAAAVVDAAVAVRRGRGNRPQLERQPTRVTGMPGGPTGEGAEAEAPAEWLSRQRSRCRAPLEAVEGRSGAVHRSAGLRQEHMVQAP